MFNPANFVLSNVADTCSLWNILASRVLYTSAKQAGVSVCCTQFVRYECLHKPGEIRPERTELQARLKREVQSQTLMWCEIDLEDLQNVRVLEQRKNLSKGELSTIVFAKKAGLEPVRNFT